MGADLVERSPAAAAVYARADAALGIPLSKMILEGPADELDLTINAQPAILATSVAFLDALREEAGSVGVEIVPRLMDVPHLDVIRPTLELARNQLARAIGRSHADDRRVAEIELRSREH